MLSLKFLFKGGGHPDWELNYVSQYLMSHAERLRELSILENEDESQDLYWQASKTSHSRTCRRWRCLFR
ncbi:hypothetical protein Hypma_014116 [Hypsizygus marmoreus]|uniref:Uncharacterized protein n=1 Tax=Hypsizygus marmoreus TaxID=39966 RepID=A0A369K5U1_HYPMA|nr:hypothetical protein Hypma_014116 [Hypsizygus marmoreus]